MLKSVGVVMVLALGAAGWWGYRSAAAERKSAKAELGQLKSTIAELREGDAQLRRDLQTLQQERYERASKTSELALPNGSSGTGSDGAETAIEGDGTSAPEPAVEMAVALQEAFDNSARSAAWSRSALDEVTAAFTPALPMGSAVRSSECRGELCRVEVTHEAPGSHQAFMEKFLRSPTSWRGPGSARLVQTADGREATVAFFGKPGSDSDEHSAWRGGVAQR